MRSSYLLTQLVDRSAAAAPLKVALKLEDDEVSYAELRDRADALARFLAYRGVGVGDRVAVLMPKTPQAVVAVFGIMKAGAAYVPLDAGSASLRWQYVLDSCGCRCLIVSANCLETLLKDGWRPCATCFVILADAAEPADRRYRELGGDVIHYWGEWAATAGDAPQVETTEDSLAYVLYTSGSTGRPKGVMVSHRAALTFVEWSVAKFSLGEADRVTSHAPLHFDLSTFDIFASIAAGATVVMVPQAAGHYPVHFARFLARERISVTYLVPSALIRLVLYGELAASELAALRCVLFAGEVFPLKFLRRLASLLPHPRYFNLYGPTETNVCTYHEVTPDDLAAADGATLPIGVSCENMRTFAVSASGALVTKPGEVGELYASGPRVAAGYWGDQHATSQAFVENRFMAADFGRTYRTGDQVRLARDGKTWLFLGRRDHMVKTRGYRVELGEVESCLDSHPSVERAVVIADPDEQLGTTLRAVLQLKTGSGAPDQRELRAFCARTLPGYMIPECFELRNELPLTSSGKVDRQLLAAQRLATSDQ